MSGIRIIKAGPMTTVQDAGRPGYRHWGLARCGVMDRPAQAYANWLVGNAADTPVLEIAQGLLELEALQPVLLSVAGGLPRVTRNGQPCWPGWPILLDAGDRLKLAGMRDGCFTTVAMGGGLDLAPELGSVSTDLFAGVGGWHGRALQPGDCLPLRAVGYPPRHNQGLRLPANDFRVRVLPGPARERLGERCWQGLLRQVWQVGAGSGRMATLLQGEPLPVPEIHLPSRMVLPGTVQLPPSGQPMVLQPDAQSTGGYPELAMVLEWDLWKLAQARPGQRIRFQAVSHRQAVKIRTGWQHHLQQLFARRAYP